VKFVSEAESGIMDDVLLRIIPLIGAEQVIEKFIVG
jgi:mRNA interferase MazF